MRWYLKKNTCVFFMYCCFFHIFLMVSGNNSIVCSYLKRVARAINPKIRGQIRKGIFYAMLMKIGFKWANWNFKISSINIHTKIQVTNKKNKIEFLLEFSKRIFLRKENMSKKFYIQSNCLSSIKTIDSY